VRRYQESVRPISRGEMVRPLPGASQNHDTSGGKEDGSGGSGYRRPNLNEDDHGKKEGALDGSSSGHQTRINVCSTKSTSSESAGFQIMQVSELRAP
jgi:hypothetical protein